MSCTGASQIVKSANELLRQGQTVHIVVDGIARQLQIAKIEMLGTDAVRLAAANATQVYFIQADRLVGCIAMPPNPGATMTY